ncbi:MAG TPA: RNA polymerase sigma factor [Pyrinomonadaceae bacterium]|jgi:RNA polymerase sigma-70 factor (ECF subfamily)
MKVDATNADGQSAQPDGELARLAASGDAAAFEEIHRRYRRLVYGVALRMTGNPVDAEDLTQESFLSVLRHIGSFRGDAPFASWLYRLAVNQVRMHFRWHRRRPEDQTTDGRMPEPHAVGARRGDAPAVMERIAIERAVNALPPGYRVTFVLHDVEGREHAEIARMTNRTAGNSKSQLHKARARLRALLAHPAPVF